MSGYLLNSFKSQEVARERNKQEQRKLKVNLKGKGGPEAVYRLNLEKLNQEQRLIARDLGRMKGSGRPKLAAPGITPLAITLGKEERMIQKQLQTIRQGVHKHPGTQSLLTPDKQFHHPDFPLVFNESLESPRHKSGDELIEVKGTHKLHRDTHLNVSSDDSDLDFEDREINGFMIMQYLDQLKNDSETRDPILHPSDDSVLNAPVNHKSIKTHKPDTELINKARVKQQSDIIIDEVETGQPEQSNEVLRVAQIERNRFTNSGVQTNSRRNLKVNDVGIRKSLSGGATRSNKGDFHLQRQSPPLDLSTLANLDMSKVRDDVSKRLSKDSGTISHKSATKNGHLMEKKSSYPRADLSNVERKSLSAGKSTTQKSPDVSMVTGASSSAQKQERRHSKVLPVEELMKNTVHDPDMYNPDGSLKTMLTLPSFDKLWEEAQKARYVRTNKPMERDRELTANEIYRK